MLDTFHDCSSSVLVKAGTFEMGSRLTGKAISDMYGGQADNWRDEKPVHRVTISGDFHMSVYETTVSQFRRFVDATGYTTTAERQNGAYVWTGSKWEKRADANWRNPYFEQNGSHPVVCVSWYDAIAYCSWLSEQEGMAPCYSGSGDSICCDFCVGGYRLPTEAEWEYAARSGGKPYIFSWGDGQPEGNIADESAKAEFGWFGSWKGYDDGYAYTAPVGQFAPNDLGIYDLSGNVWEFCWDWYGDAYYASSPAVDPTGPASGISRVRRGGSWSCDGRALRVAVRRYDIPSSAHDTVGFRTVRTEPK